MSARTKHVVLWGAWYGSRNVGDQALLLAITRMLEDLVGDIRFTVLTNNKPHVESYAARESGCRIDVLQSRRELRRVVAAIRDADLLIFGGGVPFFDAPWQLCVMGFLAATAQLFGTPLMTWSTASQEIRRPAARRLFRWIGNRAAAVTCRDDSTLRMLKNCGVSRPLNITADAVFRLEPEKSRIAHEIIGRSGRRIETRPLAALTPRLLRSSDSEAATHYNDKSAEECRRIVDVFATACDWLWGAGYQPIFIPMNTVAPDDDREAARLVLEKTRCRAHCLFVDESIRPRVASSVYGQCDLAFVARVHGAVTAMLGRCPMMMYAFAPKHFGMMQSLGMERFTLDERSADGAAATRMLSELITSRGAVRSLMLARLVQLREDALAPARIAAEILELTRSDANSAELTDSLVARTLNAPLPAETLREAA
ncbi:MAG: polysaccharide pyruvyl transferase family protein [Planctomycetaceae bacterium]